MPLKTAFTCILIVTALRLLPAAALTPAEIQQIESDLGITLSAAEKTELAQIAKPDGLVPQWRTDAEARIEANRKADLGIRVVDLLGNPVEGADVLVELKKHAFRFSGVVQAQDLTDDSGNLSGAGSTPADWERLVKGLFNAVGTGNNFKPRLASLHQYLPGFLDWAEANDARGARSPPHLAWIAGDRRNGHARQCHRSRLWEAPFSRLAGVPECHPGLRKRCQL
jgi:hypothetical protein